MGVGVNGDDQRFRKSDFIKIYFKRCFENICFGSYNKFNMFYLFFFANGGLYRLINKKSF